MVCKIDTNYRYLLRVYHGENTSLLIDFLLLFLLGPQPQRCRCESSEGPPMPIPKHVCRKSYERPAVSVSSREASPVLHQQQRRVDVSMRESHVHCRLPRDIFHLQIQIRALQMNKEKIIRDAAILHLWKTIDGHFSVSCTYLVSVPFVILTAAYRCGSCTRRVWLLWGGGSTLRWFPESHARAARTAPPPAAAAPPPLR